MSRSSILGPLLFHIFINNLFFNTVKSQVCNFAYDNTLHSSDKKVDTFFYISNMVLKMYWADFKSIPYKQTLKKFNLWFLGINRTLFLSKIWMEELTTPERLNCSELSSIITWNLRNTLKTNAKKLHLNFMLCRIRKFLTAGKARILANTFINSQFNYAPLIWMFARKIAINIILKIHYKILQVVYSENSKSYEEHFHLRARSLVVRNLRSDTKGLRFDSGC